MTYMLELLGVRISDILEIKWSDIVNNRLYYEMNKNDKPVSLKIPDKAMAIIDLYNKGISNTTSNQTITGLTPV